MLLHAEVVRMNERMDIVLIKKKKNSSRMKRARPMLLNHYRPLFDFFLSL